MSSGPSVRDVLCVLWSQCEVSSGPSVSLDNSGDPYLEESTVCVCVCVCVCVIVGVWVYVSVCACVHVCTCTCMCTLHVWVCGCTCVCVCGGTVCLNTNVGFNAPYTCNVCCVGCNGYHV